MVYNKKNRLYALKKAGFIVICLLCTAVISYEGYSIYRKINNGKPAEAAIGSVGAPAGKAVTVVRAKDSMKQGELVEKHRVEIVEVPAELVPEGAVTSLSQLSGMMLRHGIAEKEFLNDMDLITKAASYEEDDRLIEHSFQEGAVPAAVVEGSIVDIKLFIKRGEDPVVISKAVVISRSTNLLSFFMNKQEQEYLKEAETEGMLFCVLYLDETQPASQVTYVPSYERRKE